jgi:tetratricopeptide (TPR) repeat protein
MSGRSQSPSDLVPISSSVSQGSLRMTPHRRSRIAVRALLCCAALASAPAVGRADIVTLIPGTTFKQGQGGAVRGTVQSESPSEVVVAVGNSTINVPTDQIARIEYNGQPAMLQLGETHENGGRFTEAIAQYKKAAADAAGKPFVVQSALFHEASALAELAMVEPDQVKEAKDRFSTFLKTYPASRHAAAAREGLARLLMHTGDFKGAEAAIAELAKLPRAAERAGVLKAKLLARQGDHAGAVAELDKLIASLPDKSARQREALLAKAESLAGEEKYKEAEALVRQIIAAAPAEDVAAQSSAYNTLGDCLRAANRPRDAVLAYLHTDLLYAKDKEEHPRALFQLERLFRQIGQTARADEFAQRLKAEYPRSSWLAAPAQPNGS